MNWPQSSYSSSNGSSTFGGGQQQPSSSSASSYTQHPLGAGYTGQQQQQQQGYGTPGGSSNTFSNGGFASSSAGPGGLLQQQTFSTSSPQHQQQQPPSQQGGYQQHGSMQGMGYQSFGSGAGGNQQYGQSVGFGGNVSLGQQGGAGQMMQNTNAYGGQYQPPSAGQFGSPQPGVNAAMQGGSAAPQPAVGRYLPGYLTAASLSGVSAMIPAQDAMTVMLTSGIRTEPSSNYFHLEPRWQTLARAITPRAWKLVWSWFIETLCELDKQRRNSRQRKVCRRDPGHNVL